MLGLGGLLASCGGADPRRDPALLDQALRSHRASLAVAAGAVPTAGPGPAPPATAAVPEVPVAWAPVPFPRAAPPSAPPSAPPFEPPSGPPSSSPAGPGAAPLRAGSRPMRAAELTGQDAAGLTRLLGPPALRRVEGEAEIWRYAGAGCHLDLILYAENGGPPRVAWAAARAEGAGRVTEAECLRGLGSGAPA